MVSMKDMNSAGGFELLTLRREEAPTKTVSMKTLLEHREFFDEQCAILIDKLKAAADLNIRLAAYIIDLNGKIIELEAKLKGSEAYEGPGLRLRPHPQRRAHRMGLTDAQCQECGMSRIVIEVDRSLSCKGKSVNPED